MGVPKAHFLVFFLSTTTITTCCCFLLLIPCTTAADLYNLIYKGCANQTFTSGGPAASQQSLAALSTTLTAQSATAKFYKTTTAAAAAQPLSGLYQCRGDLSSTDCAACIARALPMWSSLCPDAVASRVQLSGCYALYQVSNFPQVSGTQLLFKTCSSASGASGFEVRRDTAFADLESGIVAAANAGFYATSYQSVQAMAQCQGDLSKSDCGECVRQAVQKSEVECGGAGAGQLYLNKCYITYSYGDATISGGGGSGGGGGGGFGGQQTGKTVAIVVGGAAGLGFLVICLLFARSLLKKKDDY